MKPIFSLITAGFLFFILLSTTAQTQEPYTGNTSVFVTYKNADHNSALDKSPTVYISFDDDDRKIPFIMDTGSVGIVTSADLFNPTPDSQDLGEGHQYYSSSGIIEEGHWYTATQKIYDANGTLLATAKTPVLRVTSIKCVKDARHCEPKDHPKHISVMGIGFGRESKGQHKKTPEYNPFLNLQSVLQNGTLKPLPHDWCNGYVVTSTGVHLGLTAANTANAGFVKLEPWQEFSTSKLREWKPAPMTLTVNGHSENGHVLMDTGVGTGYLTPPHHAHLGELVECSNSKRKECLPDHDEIKVYLPHERNPVAYYSFKVGDDHNTMKPNGVHVVKGDHVFFNTSRHVLNGFNYIYDNTNGYVGYIWKGISGPELGFVHPSTISTTTSLAVSQNPVKKGKKVTFKIRIAGQNFSDSPTGIVELFINDQYIAHDHVNNSKAEFEHEFGSGSYAVVAKYSGDSTYSRSTSQVLELAVEP